jgi:hypothetical protein
MFGSVLFSAAILYHGNPYRNQKSGIAYSIFIWCRNVATYKWKIHNGEIEIIS